MTMTYSQMLAVHQAFEHLNRLSKMLGNAPIMIRRSRDEKGNETGPVREDMLVVMDRAELYKTEAVLARLQNEGLHMPPAFEGTVV